ncbi:uncharacterized protein LOC141905580 isoform X2 [Tubulanus polymorphus]|uniref:uncharacterized protein LOC141905580 isoform X2 n=1 Tax=Tubulanus polymorphus TaxID=672921 RepID=UPI003DA32DF9
MEISTRVIQNTIFIQDDMYWVFDSHSRDASGMMTADGHAVLVRYSCVNCIVKHCQNLAASMNQRQPIQYEITVASINHEIETTVENSIIETTTTYSPNYQQTSSEDELPYTNPKVDECDVIVTSESVQHDDLIYNPLEKGQCKTLCSILGIHCRPSTLGYECMPKYDGQLYSPCNTQKIKGDGSCFFRAISYSICGTEQYHRAIRTEVLKHMRQNSDKFQPHLRNPQLTINEYIDESRMKYTGNGWLRFAGSTFSAPNRV